MVDKTKITLTEEMETLLIPLYSKAVESQQPNPILVDTKAQEILAQVEYDFAKLKTPVHWGIDDARDMESWADGIRLQEEWSFDQAEEINRLGLGYRLAFKMVGLFTVARKAHRIVHFQLS